MIQRILHVEQTTTHSKPLKKGRVPVFNVVFFLKWK